MPNASSLRSPTMTQVLMQHLNQSKAPATATPETEKKTVPTTPSFTTRRFEIDESRVLEVDQDASGQLGGGVGATIWDCELTMADMLLKEPFEEKRVLVLGAGCGLVSMLLSCQGCRVTATERRLAMKLLSHNVEKNRDVSGDIDVVELDWTKASFEDEINLPEVDVVVACDVVYPSNADVHDALIALLARILRTGAVGYMTHETRSSRIDSTFFRNLRDKGSVRAETVTSVNGNHDHVEHSLPEGIRLFRLTSLS